MQNRQFRTLKNFTIMYIFLLTLVATVPKESQASLAECDTFTLSCNGALSFAITEDVNDHEYNCFYDRYNNYVWTCPWVPSHYEAWDQAFLNTNRCSDEWCDIPRNMISTTVPVSEIYGDSAIELGQATVVGSCPDQSIVERIKVPPLGPPYEKTKAHSIERCWVDYYNFIPARTRTCRETLNDTIIICYRPPENTFVGAVGESRSAQSCNIPESTSCINYGYCIYKHEYCIPRCIDNDEDGHYEKSPNCPEGDDCNDYDVNITTCECDPGEHKPCYPGPAGTAEIGLCVSGNKSCENGVWGECVGAVLPQQEVCDGLDNDCNGVIDNNCSCTDGNTQECYSGPAGTAGTGFCKKGLQTCENSTWGSCVGEVLPVNGSCGIELCEQDPCLCDPCAPGCPVN